MQEHFIERETLDRAMYEALVAAANVIPADVKRALHDHLDRERHPLAKLHLEAIIRNCETGEARGTLPCPDTGYPIFYVRMGNHVRIREGLSAVYEVARKVVERATVEGRLRPNMVHPLTRKNPGTNVGSFIPDVQFRFDTQIKFLEITAVPKGGGGEIFGSFYKMMVPADGKKGVVKFILDSIKTATFAGKTCPPNIVGIGIGGTADICMRIAKEAAILRPIGSRHPESEIADWEEELLETMEDSGIGTMGVEGSSGLLDVHMEYASCHAAGLPVAINCQCCLARRRTAKITPDGIVYSDFPSRDFR